MQGTRRGWVGLRFFGFQTLFRMSARCMRQREYPFTRRCVCQARKAPVRRIEGGSEIRKSPSTLRHVDDVVHRLDPSDEIENNEISANFKESPLKVMDLHCGRLGDDTQCDRHCKKVNNQRYCTFLIGVINF